MRINLNKCEFGKSELELLGYQMSHEGCAPTPAKVRAVTEFSQPKTIVELRRFLGMVNFYRKSLPHAAKVQAPCDVVNFTRHMENIKLSKLTGMTGGAMSLGKKS